MIGYTELKDGYKMLRQEGLLELLGGIKRHYSDPHHILENKLASYYYNRQRKQYTSQKKKVHELIEKEEFILIILDACRFDYFQRVYQDYFSGDLEKVWSEGSKTPQWIPRTWSEYYDLTYVSGAPYMSDYRNDMLSEEYTPSEHFDQIKGVWATDWDGERFTTDPKAITDAALTEISNTEKNRLVVHHMQPHEPYIGDGSDGYLETPEIPLWNMENTSLSSQEVYELNDPKVIDRKDVDLPRYSIIDQIKSGDLTIDAWREAYEKNLRSVLDEVKEIAKYVDENSTVVISSDHGELLGERSELLNRILHMHPGDRIDPRLRCVPWLQLDQECLQGMTVPESKINDRDQTEVDVTTDEVTERLTDLGYLS
jgi:hypothetical protein